MFLRIFINFVLDVYFKYEKNLKEIDKKVVKEIVWEYIYFVSGIKSGF